MERHLKWYLKNMYFKQFGVFQNNVCQCIIIILCNGKLIELG